MVYELYNWESIKDEFSHNLLLGNGASISIHKDFTYPSIFKQSCDNDLISSPIEKLFKYFHTDNFEVLLRLLLNARRINTFLKIEERRTSDAYEEVRNALVKTIVNVHPGYDQVEKYLPKMAHFMKGFTRVFCLNYDLLVYWAMLKGNDIYGTWFKDGFVGSNNVFDINYREYLFKNHPSSKGTTLVFYPHGSLFIASDYLGNEIKVCHYEDSQLIDSILNDWGNGANEKDLVPLFVSEGKMTEKLRRIMNSLYLRIIYEKELSNLQDSLVIYGWSFSKQDFHIMEALAFGNIKKIAVSLHNIKQNPQKRCEDIAKIIKYFPSLQKSELYFFDSDCKGCWIH